MKLVVLDKSIWFPPVENALDERLLAIGGDLSEERLLLAYSSGIFPWFSEDQPIAWWSPDPRFVLFPEDLYISKSMRLMLNKNKFKVTTNQNFKEVIIQCAIAKRNFQYGTWITDEMIDAYINLYNKGFAHSVEVWNEDELVGGLYGIRMGKCFFGESMFAKTSNASKFGFISFVEKLKERGYVLIDCQVHTDHLESLGAVEIPKKMFLDYLAANAHEPTWKGKWTDLF